MAYVIKKGGFYESKACARKNNIIALLLGISLQKYMLLYLYMKEIWLA